MKWLREIIRAHYWPDWISAVLFDLLVIMLIVFGVVAGITLASR